MVVRKSFCEGDMQSVVFSSEMSKSLQLTFKYFWKREYRTCVCVCTKLEDKKYGKMLTDKSRLRT